LLDYKAKYRTVSNAAYLPAFRVVEMLAGALDKAGTTDPVKVAYSLEGLKYAGPSGASWMRAEDHQMIAPLYILNLVKAGQAGVKYDEEKTGYGWKTETFIEAKDIVPPVKCQMERPPI
jgi:branched-chain amino acid transport system substrate-binding protein